MKIEKIQISNFRLLHSFSLDVEDNLSLVIGKNNTGKTSFLALLNRFLKETGNTFSIDDFSIQSQENLQKIVEDDKILEDELFSLSLKLIISYEDHDNLINISDFLLNLSPTENKIILSFKYGLDKENLKRLKSDFKEYNKEFKEKNVLDFLKHNQIHRTYFKTYKWSAPLA
ncbi:DUF2813 domain-containing protein [Candidatus Marinimicrobia bacterium MT.SAG.2]|nr:DUF2813 domain-containing protein [Candidatus Marinimicrobia bacterium MT.SAG.2]